MAARAVLNPDELRELRRVADGRHAADPRHWHCVCGTRIYQSTITLAEVECDCGVGKGRWACCDCEPSPDAARAKEAATPEVPSDD